VYKGKVNCKKAQEHLENVTNFLKIPSTRNFINWKLCICCMARRRVGIPGNHDVRSYQECWWPFLYRTSTAPWFVANTAGWGNPTAPHQSTTKRKGQGGHVVCMLMGFMNSRVQEVKCVYKPPSRTQDDQGMARNSTTSDGPPWRVLFLNLMVWTLTPVLTGVDKAENLITKLNLVWKVLIKS